MNNIAATITHQRDVQEFTISAGLHQYGISIYLDGKEYAVDMIYKDGNDNFIIENKTSTAEDALKSGIQSVLNVLKNCIDFEPNGDKVTFLVDGACPHVKADEARQIAKNLLNFTHIYIEGLL